MEQTKYKYEITFKSSYTKEELGDMVEVWLKRSLENMLDQQCELDSFILKEIVSEQEEEINEEELDKLAFKSASPSLQDGRHSLKLYKDGFKAGYRKAMKK